MENTEKKKNGLAKAGMVLGIIGICTSFIPIVNNASFVLGVLAAVFGIISLIKKSSRGNAVIALVLGVLAIAITLVYQASLSNTIDDAFDDLDSEIGAMTGEQTEAIMKNDLDINIGEFKIIDNEFYDESELKVTIKNKGSETSSFSVEIEAVNSDGDRITTDTIYVSNLKAGQSQEFEAFTLVDSDKYDALKNATFKVLEVSKY